VVKQIVALATTLVVIFIYIQNGYSYDKGFEKETIERLTRLETKVEGLQRQIDDVKADLADLKDFMLWGFGITFAGMMTLIGFVLWDRRTALAPAIRKNKELEEREERLEKALREYAKKEPRLAEILKNMGLM
jgi:ammonia channel protein AmtB